MMHEDKNHQQVDWGDCIDDWDNVDWDDPNGYGHGEDCAPDSSGPIEEKDGTAEWSTIKESKEYSRNWKYTSRDLRERHNFQCQQCYAILIERQHLLHVHHKNRSKKDNRTSNLRVLCVLCHAEEEGHSHLFHGIDASDIDHIKKQRINAKPLEPKKKVKLLLDKDDHDDEYWDDMEDLYPDYPR